MPQNKEEIHVIYLGDGETWDLAKEARVEIRKVVWPTRQETTQTTLIVVVMVIFVGLILWALDSTLSWSVSGLIG